MSGPRLNRSGRVPSTTRPATPPPYYTRLYAEFLCSGLLSVRNSSPSSEEQNCSICWSEIDNGKKAVSIDICGHVFHKKCILPWFAKDEGFTCPNCRAKLFLPDWIRTVPKIPSPSRHRHAGALAELEARLAAGRPRRNASEGKTDLLEELLGTDEGHYSDDATDYEDDYEGDNEGEDEDEYEGDYEGDYEDDYEDAPSNNNVFVYSNPRRPQHSFHAASLSGRSTGSSYFSDSNLSIGKLQGLIIRTRSHVIHIGPVRGSFANGRSYRESEPAPKRPLGKFIGGAIRRIMGKK